MYEYYQVSQEPSVNEEENTQTMDNQIGSPYASMTNIALLPAPDLSKSHQFRTSWHFIRTALSFTSAAGNTWHLATLCLRNGGGHVLLQFLICVVFIGMPMLYMEMVLGQYSSASPLLVFARISPAFRGLSASMCSILLMRSIVLAVWFAFSFYHVCMCFTGLWSPLPWRREQSNDTLIYANFREVSECMYTGDSDECRDVHQSILDYRGEPEELFQPFNRYLSQDLYERESSFAPPSWLVVLGLALAWSAALSTVIFGGVRFLGKSAYVHLVTSVITTLVLLLIGLSLDGGSTGIVMLLRVDFLRFVKLSTWPAAAAQAIFVLNLGCGGWTSLASYKRFADPIQRNVVIVGVYAAVMQILAVITVFAFIGNIAELSFPGNEFEDSVHALAKIMNTHTIIPEVLTSFPLGGLFCGLLFSVVLVWALQSMALTLLCVWTMCNDRWHIPSQSSYKRLILLSVFILAGTVVGLIFLFPGSIRHIFIIEQYTCYATLVICLIQIIIVSYIYGFRRFTVNVISMIGSNGRRLNWFWWVNWTFIAPSLIIASIVVGGVNEVIALTFNMPLVSIGYVLIVLILLWIPVGFFIEDQTRRKHKQPVAALFQPSSEWGPHKISDRTDAVKIERAMRVR